MLYYTSYFSICNSETKHKTIIRMTKITMLNRKIPISKSGI